MTLPWNKYYHKKVLTEFFKTMPNNNYYVDSYWQKDNADFSSWSNILINARKEFKQAFYKIEAEYLFDKKVEELLK